MRTRGSILWMPINRKHSFTRSRWIEFNSWGGPVFPAAGAAFYGESLAIGYSPERGRNFGSGKLPVGVGLHRDQEGIQLHGGSPRQYLRGNAVRGNFGEAWERCSGGGDRHSQ